MGFQLFMLNYFYILNSALKTKGCDITHLFYYLPS